MLCRNCNYNGSMYKEINVKDGDTVFVCPKCLTQIIFCSKCKREVKSVKTKVSV